jgi:hypothetical protein
MFSLDSAYEMTKGHVDRSGEQGKAEEDKDIGDNI